MPTSATLTEAKLHAIESAERLGQLIRQTRKRQNLTLETV